MDLKKVLKDKRFTSFILVSLLLLVTVGIYLVVNYNIGLKKEKASNCDNPYGICVTRNSYNTEREKVNFVLGETPVDEIHYILQKNGVNVYEGDLQFGNNSYVNFDTYELTNSAGLSVGDYLASFSVCVISNEPPGGNEPQEGSQTPVCTGISEYTFAVEEVSPSTTVSLNYGSYCENNNIPWKVIDTNKEWFKFEIPEVGYVGYQYSNNSWSSSFIYEDSFPTKLQGYLYVCHNILPPYENTESFDCDGTPVSQVKLDKISCLMDIQVTKVEAVRKQGDIYDLSCEVKNVGDSESGIFNNRIKIVPEDNTSQVLESYEFFSDSLNPYTGNSSFLYNITDVDFSLFEDKSYLVLCEANTNSFGENGQKLPPNMEKDTSNNVTSTRFVLEPPPQVPDLQINNVSALFDSESGGYDLSCEYQNYGQVTANVVSHKLYLKNINNEEKSVNIDDLVNDLVYYQKKTISSNNVDITSAGDEFFGTPILGCEIVWNNGQKTIKEIEVNMSRPDFLIERIDISPTTQNGVYKAECVIKNNGGTAYSNRSFKAKVIWDSVDPIIYEYDDTFQGGQNISLVFFKELTEGSHSFTCIADNMYNNVYDLEYFNSNIESNEDNNILSKEFEIKPAELVLENAKVIPNYETGKYDISVDVKNIGDLFYETNDELAIYFKTGNYVDNLYIEPIDGKVVIHPNEVKTVTKEISLIGNTNLGLDGTKLAEFMIVGTQTKLAVNYSLIRPDFMMSENVGYIEKNDSNQYRLICNVKNNENKIVTPYDTYFYMKGTSSVSGSVDKQNIDLNHSHEQISPDEIITGSSDWFSLDSGKYTFECIADSDNSFSEDNEGDNIYSFNYEIVAPAPDLVVKDIRIDYLENGGYKFVCKVKNEGAVVASNYSWHILAIEEGASPLSGANFETDFNPNEEKEFSFENFSLMSYNTGGTEPGKIAVLCESYVTSEQDANVNDNSMQKVIEYELPDLKVDAVTHYINSDNSYKFSCSYSNNTQAVTPNIEEYAFHVVLKLNGEIIEDKLVQGFVGTSYFNYDYSGNLLKNGTNNYECIVDYSFQQDKPYLKIRESDETNNKKSNSFLRSSPDFMTESYAQLITDENDSLYGKYFLTCAYSNIGGEYVHPDSGIDLIARVDGNIVFSHKIFIKIGNVTQAYAMPYDYSYFADGAHTFSCEINPIVSEERIIDEAGKYDNNISYTNFEVIYPDFTYDSLSESHWEDGNYEFYCHVMNYSQVKYISNGDMLINFYVNPEPSIENPETVSYYKQFVVNDNWDVMERRRFMVSVPYYEINNLKPADNEFYCWMDYGNAVLESDESNNIGKITFGSYLPDLTSQVQVSGGNDRYGVNCQISNIGYADSTGIHKVVYKFGSLTHTEEYDTTIRGFDSMITRYVFDTSTLDNGTYDVSCLVDPDNTINETDEENNESSKISITIDRGCSITCEYPKVISDDCTCICEPTLVTECTNNGKVMDENCNCNCSQEKISLCTSQGKGIDENCNCVCSNTCAPGLTLNPNTCGCECLLECPSPKVPDNACSRCECTNECTGNYIRDPNNCSCNCGLDCGSIKIPSDDCNSCKCPNVCGTNEWQDNNCECHPLPGCNLTCDSNKQPNNDCTACECRQACAIGFEQDPNNCSCSCNLDCGPNKEPNSSCSGCLCSNICEAGELQDPNTCECYPDNQCNLVCDDNKQPDPECRTCECRQTCSAGFTQNPTDCSCSCALQCGSGKEANSSCNACLCKNTCNANELQDPNTCECIPKNECELECGDNKSRNTDCTACVCNQSCPSGYTQNEDCSCSCNVTCGPRQVKQADCTCKDVECTSDKHCSGLKSCTSGNVCQCVAKCPSNMIMTGDCASCVCSNKCAVDEKQLSDCSCVKKDEPLIVEPVEVKISIVIPVDGSTYKYGSKLALSYKIEQGYDVNKDKVEWVIDGEVVGVGNALKHTFEKSGDVTVVLKYEGIEKDSVKIKILEKVGEVSIQEDEEPKDTLWDFMKKNYILTIAGCCTGILLVALIVVYIVRRRKYSS